ncbi:phage tail protein [Cupriavidus metallidurans]|uniref:phage tail protein n=1 Tax=Cupriavidus metallidurans TaxID=119219 RepID=UPI001CCA7C78|nr:phage tail protein [Cupriavidus metallidurans]UBM12754.1 phage tail protein [Cupriavidus metallidurans]
MPRQTFTWFPDVGSDNDAEPRVSTIAFGDGYESRVRLGINTLPQKWTLKFTRAPGEGNAIAAFLRARGGFESFIWITPERERGFYVCRKWKVSRPMGLVVVSCVFEQVFEAA